MVFNGVRVAAKKVKVWFVMIFWFVIAVFVGHEVYKFYDGYQIRRHETKLYGDYISDLQQKLPIPVALGVELVDARLIHNRVETQYMFDRYYIENSEKYKSYDDVVNYMTSNVCQNFSDAFKLGFDYEYSFVDEQHNLILNETITPERCQYLFM